MFQKMGTPLGILSKEPSRFLGLVAGFGMNYGIYYIDNVLDEWELFDNNLPNVIVNKLEINEAGSSIYATIYGCELCVVFIRGNYQKRVHIQSADAYRLLGIFPIRQVNT